MRPDRLKQNSPLETGPQGFVPEAFHDAQILHGEGQSEKALALLNTLFRPGDLQQAMGRQNNQSLRDAALLKAWCLIELKRQRECSHWLETARQLGHFSQKDVTATILELNLQLFSENYELVQQSASQMLARMENAINRDQAELHLLLGAALRWQGFLSESIPHLEFADSTFLVLGESGRQAVAANFLGWTHLSMGHLNEGRRWFEKSLQINTGLGAVLRMAQNYQNLSIVSYKQGAYQKALDLLEKEMELVKDSPDMTCRANIAWGNVQRLRGNFPAARRALMEAYTLAPENGLAREEALALEFLGDVFRDEGNPAEARRYYQRGLAVARSLAPRGDLVMELMRREGECLDLEGRHEEAHHVLNDALALCREVGDRFEKAVTRRCLGVNAANLGRWKNSVDHLNSAITTLKDLAASHETMIASYRLAVVLARQIDTGNAGASSSRLLEESWNHALASQQLHKELDISFMGPEIDDLISSLARRRLVQGDPSIRPVSFSTRMAPTSRVIAVSSAMQQVLKSCDGYSRYDTPVLISGEAGTGKELLAHRIHEIGPRCNRPLVKVNCTTTADDVLARELFGQTRPGKGGLADVPGLVAQAEGGTLLLSDVADLPRSIQGKLMDLLQDGNYRPLGDSRPRKANVRIIATSSVDLKDAVASGQLRPDLQFKLSLMKVPVPPLRERTEDIMPLLDHFLTRLEGSTLSARSLFDFQAMEALACHHWAGNVAELESVAQRGWLNRDMGQSLRLRRIESKAGAALEFMLPTRSPESSSATVEKHPIGGMTWNSLNTLINRAGGNKSHVARSLGISRVTLYRWLDRLQP